MKAGSRRAEGLEVYSRHVGGLFQVQTSGEFCAMVEWIEFLKSNGMDERLADPVVWLAGVLVLALLAWLTNLLAKKVILRVVHVLIARSEFVWFKILQEEKVFSSLSHVAPAIVIQRFAPMLFERWPEIIAGAKIGVNIYLIIVALLVVGAVLNSVVNGYERREKSQGIPVKGFVQAIKLVIYLFGMILIVATFLGKEPLYLLSGLGALTAVMMLVFKDAILGFVAGIQLSANDMVRKGDWIEMPKQQADGDVIDVSLTTVKVQNWDKTITMIPSYMLISDSFRNWRGMQRSGGRRIKRSLLIDTRSVRFVDRELLDRAKKFNLLRPYLEKVLAEIQQHNLDGKLEVDDLLNGRHLTNLGIFRAYGAAYLRNHPKIHQGHTQIVRQTAPNEHGIPMEFYCFTNDIGWVAYEAIQGDIFDHMLAIIPHFGLQVFQAPSGRDLEAVAGALSRPMLTESTAESYAVEDGIKLSRGD